MSNNELTIIPPQQLMRAASDVAGVCKEIVTKTAVNIAGNKYVKCEGWQSIATAYGCVASARDVARVYEDGKLIGFAATGEIRRVSDGITLCTSEGFVGFDEPQWEKRPEYAKRAMAQTRAISRACRSAFAFVVVLMDAGLSTVPAEEVPDGGFDDHAQGQTQPQTSGNGSKTASKPSAASQQRQSAPSENAEGWKGVQIHFGKNSGTPLGSLQENSRLWYQVNWQPDANRTSQKDQDLRDALDDSIKEFSDDAVLRGAFKSAIQKFAEEKKFTESELDLFNKEAAHYIKNSEPETDVTDVKNLNAVNLQMIYLKRDEFLDTIRDTAAAE